MVQPLVQSVDKTLFTEKESTYCGVVMPYAGLILGLHPANDRCRYKVTVSLFVTTSLIGWAQTLSQPWYGITGPQWADSFSLNSSLSG